MKLITYAVGAISRDKKLGRAEALRRAMLAMIDKGEAARGASGLLGALHRGRRRRGRKIASALRSSQFIALLRTTEQPAGDTP